MQIDLELVGLFIVAVIVGAIVGRWWALLLPFLLPLSLAGAGSDRDQVPLWLLVLAQGVPVLLLGVAIGLGARRFFERRRQRMRA